MSTNQEFVTRHEAAEAFIAMLTDLRAEFDREAASVQEEARGRSLALAGEWMAEQEGRIWRRVLGNPARQREIVHAMLGFWALPVEVRQPHVGPMRRFDELLHAFADGLLRSACKRRDVKEYQRALIALAVCDEGRDWRDTLVSLCIYWHAGVRLGLDTRSLFAGLADEATQGAAELLRGFAQRPPQDQRLDAFGHSERDLDELFLVD